ncbi:CHC2 zinc finger domain-containing protein [Falsiruegeria litorea]|uniref:CHC2 zinc finger domain-containing protein n=1 Tax=Falsiruegeria litorea TaxID=1280831 RepID=UPI001BFE452D|nr:CHC2 zinc finger domain-containing protein [Falsiruegeria litorea]MBT8169889.1 hypothetical protein [Falsiruegeria litorea]
MALSDEVKARVSLRLLAEQTVTWDTFKTNTKRGDYWAPCPLHGEATPSFHVTEPKGTGGQFYCFGCGAKGSAIDFLMERDALSFTAAVRLLADAEQIDRNPDPARLAKIKAEAEARQNEAAQEAERKAEDGLRRALKIWRSSTMNHPRLLRYLEARGVDLGAIGGLPPTLRYHPDLPCYEGEDENKRPRMIWRGPAMVAFIGRRKLVGIHRTWITDQGRARTPEGRKVPKQMLGRTGEIFGLPVKLTKAGCPTMIVGEGIETTLGALSAFKGEKRPSAEAALCLDALCGPADQTARPGGLGRSGKRLPSPVPDLQSPRPGWLPPEGVTKGVILADPSAKCPETARLNGERALAKIAPRCTEGARLAIPRGHWDHDDDFADLAKKGEFHG